MSKATLEFNLNDVEDLKSFERSNKSLELTFALLEIAEYLRSRTKHVNNVSDDVIIDRHAFREKFFEILNLRDINLDNLLS